MLARRRLTTAALCAAALGAGALVAVGGQGVAAAAAAPGATVRASLTAAGGEIPGDSYEQAMSGNGRFVVFVSTEHVAEPWTGCVVTDTTCTANDTHHSAVYVRDLVAGTTQQVSYGIYQASSSPAVPSPPAADSAYPSISRDGRYVSFLTDSEAVAGVVNSPTGLSSAVVVCDRGAPNAAGAFRTPVQHAAATGTNGCTAVAQHNQTIDQYSYGTQSAYYGSNSFDQWPRLSGDGSRLVWSRYEPRYDAYPCYPQPPASTVYVADRTATGWTSGSPLSVPDTDKALADLLPADQAQAAISDDGSAIVTTASTVNANSCSSGGSGTPDPLVTGILEYRYAPSAQQWVPKRVDAATTTGFVGSDTVAVAHPNASADGSIVVFNSQHQLVQGAGSGFNDRPVAYAVATGTLRSAVVSTDASGTPVDGAYPVVSGDARYVSYLTDDPAAAEGVSSALDSASCLGYNTSDAGPAPKDRLPFCQAVERGLTVTSTHSDVAPSPARPQLVSRNRVCVPVVPPPAGPASVGPAGPDCTIADQDVSAPLSISLDGSRTSFVTGADNLVPNDTNGGYDGDTTYGGRDAFVRTWTPSITIGPLSFGPVKVGSSSTQSTTVTVTGFGPLPIGTATLTGPNGGEFTIGSNTCSGRTLHERETCQLSVTFTPKGTGTRTGTVSVFPPGGTTPLGTRPVTGTGSTVVPKVPQFAAAPAVVDFGTQLPLAVPGTARTVVVTNGGGAPLVIGPVTVQDGPVPGSAGDYTVSATGCSSVPAGGTCTLVVTFVGHRVGPRNATIVVTDNAAGGPHLIGLRARIGIPSVVANPGVSPVGRVTMVSGTGFAPNQQVDVGFTTAPESTTTTAAADGTFSVGLVLFPNGPQGPRTLVAHTHGADPSISAQGPLLVVLGSLEAPDIIGRH